MVTVFLVSAALCFGDSFSFKADTMLSNQLSGKQLTVLIGNAEVHSDNLILSADRIELQGEDNQFIVCTGAVRGREEAKDIMFQTDTLTYDRHSSLAVMEGNSTLEDKQNAVIAKSRYITYNGETESAIFQVGVRLFKEDMVCRAEYAVYDRTTNMLHLSGFPVVYQVHDSFKADAIQVNLNTNAVVMEGSVTGSVQ
ncbi:lipopolysaccharide export system protein LptA [Pillotina sp. SPG140]